MISLIRLEAEGKTLAEVVADLDAKTKVLKLPKELRLYDEHYERVSHESYKGRRVFKTLSASTVRMVAANATTSSTRGVVYQA